MKSKVINIEYIDQPSLEGVVDNIFATIFSNRMISSVDELDYSINNLLPPQFKDIEKAVEKLIQSFEIHEFICIVGDYDVDGLTSTVLVYKVLKELGFSNVNYFIPKRLEHGYGLSNKAIDSIVRLYPRTTLLLTVDNGITANQAVEYAQTFGIATVICDHHHSENPIVPKATAVVNPNQPNCGFESKCIAGVGVAFYLMAYLRLSMIEKGLIEASTPHPSKYLDLVALGTIADICHMDYNNRILVYQGLSIIRNNQSLYGINQILKQVNLSPANITEEALSFKLIPLLNSLGRMSDMTIGVDLLLSQPGDYNHLATIIENNNKRKEIQSYHENILMLMIEKSAYKEENQIVIEYHKDFHPGILGILATRAREATDKSAIIFTDSPDEDDPNLIIASGRSLQGINLKSVMDQIYNNYPELIVRYGGHSQAMALTINRENLEQFKHLINLYLQDTPTEQIKLKIDMKVLPEIFRIDFVNKLEMSGPWGKGFEYPIFSSEFTIKKITIRNKTTLIYLNDDQGNLYKAIDFKSHIKPINTGDKIRLFYRPRVEEFKHKKSVTFYTVHIEILE